MPSGVRAVIEKSASVVAVVGEQTVARGDGGRARVGLEEAGGEDLPGGLPPRSPRDRAPNGRARASGSRSAVRSTNAFDGRCTSADRARASAPDLRAPAAPGDRQIDRPLERRVVEHVRRGRGRRLPDRDGDGDRRVGDAARGRDLRRRSACCRSRLLTIVTRVWSALLSVSTRSASAFGLAGQQRRRAPRGDRDACAITRSVPC